MPSKIKDANAAISAQLLKLESQPECAQPFRNDALEFLAATGIVPIVTTELSLCGVNGDACSAHGFDLSSCTDFGHSLINTTDPMLTRENIPPLPLGFHRGYASPCVGNLIVGMAWGLRAPAEYDFVAKTEKEDGWHKPRIYNDTSMPS